MARMNREDCSTSHKGVGKRRVKVWKPEEERTLGSVGAGYSKGGRMGSWSCGASKGSFGLGTTAKD